jgi:filamentous hemagglutinin family protein
MRLFVFILIASALHAKPDGMRVVAGASSELRADGDQAWAMDLGKKTILEWDQFSIDLGEKITFNQADFHSKVLNRIVGGNESQLMGQLVSNGKVFIINPNGVFIGKNARIETASFIASSLDVLDSEFLNSDSMLFSGKSEKAVVNLGTIVCPCGEIALLGRVVRNEGELLAPDGAVSMGSGSEILLMMEDPHSLILPSNSSDLKATENPFALAIQHKGIVKARRVQMYAGQGVCEVEGKIDAVSETAKGGDVAILGERVHLLDGAEIDASGKLGGGTILIGGDYQGKNPEVKNALVTWVEKGAKVQANCLEQGDGGKVIFWGEQHNHFAGFASVDGGSKGGDGGLIEVSSPVNLEFLGRTSALAPLGKMGLLYLDPPDVTISGSATTAMTFDMCAFTPGAVNPINIKDTDLEACLNSGSVTIDTSTGTGAGTGSITVSVPIGWILNSTFTLIADQAVLVNASITNDSMGAGNRIVLQGNSTGATTGTFNGVDVEAALQCVTDGNIVISGKAGSGNGIGVLMNAPVSTANGSITFSNCVGGGSGSNNYGLALFNSISAPTITAVTNIQGGSGMGDNYGCHIDGTGIVGDATKDQVIAITATGGSGASGAQFGLSIGGAIIQTGNVGSITLTGTGGTGGSSNFGINFSSATLNAGTTASSSATITITGVGGSGSGSSRGASFSSGSTIIHKGNAPFTFTGCNGGTGASGENYGILLASTIDRTTVDNGASASIVFENILAGGAGDSNIGVYLLGTIKAPIITATNNIHGGDGSATNYGFFINGGTVGSTANQTLSITAAGGGTGAAGTSSNYGIYMSTGTIQTGDTGSIALTGTGGGTGASGTSSNYGIYMNSGLIQSGNAGAMTLNGTGGGNAGNGGSDNKGILLSGGTLQAGTSGTSTANVTLTGVGGEGSTGSNTGVRITSDVTLTHEGTGNFRFLDCGSGGVSGGSNIGVDLATSISPTAYLRTIVFDTITGGSGGSNNYGVQLSGSSVLSGHTITATNAITGGFGTSNNFGFLITGTSLIATDGSTSITATGGGGDGMGSGNFGIYLISSIIPSGTGSVTLNGIGGLGANNNFGCYVGGTIGDNTQNQVISLTGTGGTGGGSNFGLYISGTVQTGNAGSLTLTGTGGTGTGSNYGIYFTTGTLSAGTTTTSTATITVTGEGGTGSGGSNNGVVLSGSTITHKGNAPFTFSNCSGGSGPDGSNVAVYLDAGIDRTGVDNGSSAPIVFENILGGTGGSSNSGIFLSGLINAPIITATNNIHGGDGTTDNYGFFVQGGTVGSSDNKTLSITAAGGGTGAAGTSFNLGIYMSSGFIQTGDAGSITLIGTGGGNPANSGSSNEGIFFVGGTLHAGTTMTSTANITITGTGGAGSGGGHLGAAITSSSAIIHYGTGSLTFSACHGGAGSGGSNSGLALGTSLTPDTDFKRTIIFDTVTGGTGGNFNYGVAIDSPTILNAHTITATNGIVAGVGVDHNRGFYVTGNSQITADGAISITASGNGDGTGFANYGIYVDSSNGILASGMGTVTLIGTGGPGTFTNVGILIDGSGASVSTVNGSLSITGTGGPGTNSNYGIFTGAGATVSTVNGPLSIMGTGGSGTSSNHGIEVNGSGTSVSTVDGQISITGVAGGGTSNEVLIDNNGDVSASGLGSIIFHSDLELNVCTISAVNGNLTFNEPVTTGNSMTFPITGVGDITFIGTPTSLTLGDSGIISAANGAVLIAGDVVAPGYNVTITAGTSVDVSNINTSKSGTAGNISINPGFTCTPSSLGCIPDGRIVLSGDLTASGTMGGAISLAGASTRVVAPSVATIISSYAGNSVQILGNSLTVGPGSNSMESISIIGDFLVDVTGAIQLSDTVALTSIALTGATIDFISHGDETLLLSTGALRVTPSEHMVSPSIALSGAFTGNLSNVKEVPVTMSDLQYSIGSYVLNFDGIPPPSTPSSNRTTPFEFIVQMEIANAQLSDELKLLNQQIFNRDYYLEDRCIGAGKGSGCATRLPLEYRKYL